MTELATREMLLAAPKRRFTEVTIPDWGTFRLRSLNELERSRLEASMLDKKGQLSPNKLIDHKCRLIVACVVDAEGNQLLTNGDIAALQQQDSSLTNLLVDEIQKHCGMSDADIEALEKN